MLCNDKYICLTRPTDIQNIGDVAFYFISARDKPVNTIEFLKNLFDM